MTPLIEHIAIETRRAASTNGGEWASACPRCGGEDRFRIWPEHPDDEAGRFWCRRCDWSGDGIDLLRDVGGLAFAEAARTLGLGHKVKANSSAPQRSAQAPKPNPKPKPPRLLRPPGETWQEKARAFVGECRKALWAETGAAASARDYLEGRGLRPATIRAAGLGLNEKTRRPLRRSWGLEPKEDGGRLWLPRGIVIPWYRKNGTMWKVRTRRFGDPEPKYVQAAAVRPGTEDRAAWSSNALFGATSVTPGRPAVLVEGALDALAIMQEPMRTAGAAPLLRRLLVAAVAGGGRTGSGAWHSLRRCCSPSTTTRRATRRPAGGGASCPVPGATPRRTGSPILPTC